MTADTLEAQDALKSRRLGQKRTLATSLLVVAAIVYVISTYLQPGHAAWGYVAAFSEAAMVGALADWFAVTALFRYPLGIPLPHTAIIPKNKDRIADNLGDFVQGEFFSTERIVNVIEDFNPAQRAAIWMADKDNADRLANGLGNTLVHGLDFLDQAAVRDYLKRQLAQQFVELDIATLTGTILQGLTHDNRHQALFDQALHGINSYLHTPEVRDPLVQVIVEKLPSVLGVTREAIGILALKKILESIADKIAEIDKDQEHPLRARFHEKLHDFIDQLKHDPELRDKIRDQQEALSKNEAVAEYIDGLIQDVHRWLENDLASENSVVKAKVSSLAQGLGQELLANKQLQAAINGQILEMAPAVLEDVRPKISHFISQKMKEWKDDEIVRKLELNIGPDLQYIRINGTLIGGLVGLLIHTVTVIML